MKTIHIDICPVCNSPEKEIFIQGQDFFASQEFFDIEKCKKCGFLFTQNFPAEEYIGTYYESPDYISHSNSQKGFINSIYHKVRSFMLKNKAHLIEKMSKERGSLLDIGAGTGYFGNEMQQRNWQVSLIEKSPQARDFIKQNWQINVQDENALFLFPEKTFDVITLWHVLEHLEKLNETMSYLHSILKDNGTLVLALPNAGSFDAEKYGKFWAAYDVPRHLWHFSPKTLKIFAQKHRFEIVKTKRMPFDVFYVSLLSEKYGRHPLGIIRAFFVGTAGWITSLFCINRTSSLIYILKKNNNKVPQKHKEHKT
jgi:2-polyprenyl-3-methyl-5-hydroxy-6-metoxy-1,4-benzoquinol methylase